MSEENRESPFGEDATKALQAGLAEVESRLRRNHEGLQDLPRPEFKAAVCLAVNEKIRTNSELRPYRAAMRVTGPNMITIGVIPRTGGEFLGAGSLKIRDEGNGKNKD